MAKATSKLVRVPIVPVPASRPRVTKRGTTYYAKTYEQYRRALLVLLQQEEGEPLAGPLALSLGFICPRPKTVQRDIPRSDLDNLAKGVMDAMTKSEKFWIDDEQVVFLTAWKRYVEPIEEPHIVIEVGHYESPYAS